MRFEDTTEEATWRNEVRDFLSRELPEGAKRRRGGGAPFADGGANEGNAAPSTEARVGGQGFRLQGGPLGEWRQKLAEKGWIAPAWPKEYGGAGLGIMEQFIINEEFAEAGAPAVGGMGVMMAGPDDHRPRHRGAEGGAPARHPQRRDAVVPGLQRARLRLRPRLAADARRARRRRLRDQRPEDLDLRRPVRRLDVHARPHRPGRAEAPRHQLLPARHEAPGITVQPLVNMAGGARLQPGLLRQRARARPRTSSAR